MLYIELHFKEQIQQCHRNDKQTKVGLELF